MNRCPPKRSSASSLPEYPLQPINVSSDGEMIRKMPKRSSTSAIPNKRSSVSGKPGSKRSSVSERTSRLSNIVLEAANKPRRELMQRASIATLHLSDMKLHGREADLQILKNKLSNLEDRKKKELVLVVGTSGIGKSALVEKGLREPASKKGIAFASGKFDQNRNCLPFSAFAEAMSSLAKHVLTQENAEQIKLDIKETLGQEDMFIVSSAFQGCEDIFLLDDAEKQRRGSEIGSGKEAVSRLQYAIRRLMKVICLSLKEGAILFLDDLQWGDASSLDLLQALLQDDDIANLLLVGAYRDDEVSKLHPLVLHINEAKRLGCTISTITLGNLDQPTVTNLVAEALHMEDAIEEVETLASIVYNKTGGNPFFIIFFLKSLYDDELLQYTFAIGRWRWDDDKIKEEVMTDNVASIMVKKLKRFKMNAQHLIKVASCLGASFSTGVLGMVVQRSKDLENDTSYEDSEEHDNWIEDLIEFEAAGLLEHESDDVCRFAHDKIQSAALELIPKESRDTFKGGVGQILMEGLHPEDLEEFLFDVVSLRNCASATLNAEERVQLGEMNLRCGLKASQDAAFDTAVVYFEEARNLFGEVTDLDMSIQKLYIAEAHARFVLADFDLVELLLEEVLSKDEIPMKHKFQAYEIKILSAHATNRFDVAIGLALDFRRELGFKAIPTKVSMITVLREYMKTNRAVKDRTAEDLASLPDVSDERVIYGQRMLGLLLTSTYQANPAMYPLMPFNLVQETIKSGVNESSCEAYVTFGLLLCGAFGELKRGKEMGRAAELVLNRPGMRKMKSRVRFIHEGMVAHWTSPLHNTLQRLLEGYISGLETGDTESAVWNICLRSCFSWFASRPLRDIENEISPVVGVIDQLKAIGAKHCTLPFLQGARKLLASSSESPWTLAGTAMNIEDTFKFASETGNEMVRAYTTIVQLDLFVFFQRWEDAKTLLKKAGDLRPIIIGLYHIVRFTFLEGLICLKAAQMSSSWREKRRLKGQAKKVIKMMGSWQKKGNMNVIHTLHLLNAEHSVLVGKSKEAEESFKKAAITASRHGFKQDKALAHEEAGLYYINKGDDYWAKYNLNLAHGSYLDWGAKAKAEHMEATHPELGLGKK